jgi:DNA-binding transcriptional MerR regulator
VLTISQLASYAGVTVRAVRHYHSTGLLPEPERDRSGYRRYDAHAVVELIKIRTLAEAGVPLALVRELLTAGEEEFAAAVAEIDRRLRAEIRERQALRERVAKLAAGESLALPPAAVKYLARLRELELPELMIAGERDAWILVAAQLPEQMPMYMELKRQQLQDPGTIELYREMAEMITWAPDDPRLDEMAERIAVALEKDDVEGWESLDTVMTDDLADLLDSVFLNSVPVARGLMRRLEQRGWRGWTRLERIEPASDTRRGPSPRRGAPASDLSGSRPR